MIKPEITICMGSSCFARGNAQNLAFIEEYLKENNLEANIELAGSRCDGNCASGPNIIVNGIIYNEVDEEKIKKILSAKPFI